MPSNQLIVLPSAPDISESYSAADEEILRAISRAQENLLRQQKPDGHWCGELLVDSTLCSDYVVFMYWCGEVDAQLQRRCVREGVFCTEACRLFCGCAVYAGSARDHHAPGRDPADEHVQQALPRVAWCVSMEIFAGDSAGDGASAELGSFSHLQNVVVEPGDAHPAVNHQSF